MGVLALEIERLLLRLIDLIEEKESPIKVSGAPTSVGSDLSPGVLATGIYPSSGRTVFDAPSLPTVFPTSPPQEYAPPKILEGFAVRFQNNKIIVGKGKFEKNGEVYEVGEVEISAPLPTLVVLNTETAEVEATLFRLPHHLPLAFISESGEVHPCRA